MNNKKVLLIAGGGTLGGYTAAELLKNGCAVDIICLEDYISDNPMLRYYKARADLKYLADFLADRYYDGIVNFIHYKDVEAYKPVHRLLCEKTGQLIFLSSYRVYSCTSQPITEETPRLYDVLNDKLFFEEEPYAAPKSRCEDFIKTESRTTNWTIVRPVISFSERRFDIVVPHSAEEFKKHIKENRPILLPKQTEKLTAGLDWAGNSGKLIAGLLFNEKAKGEIFTVSSAQNLTWGEVAALYTEACGITFEWVTNEEFFNENPYYKSQDPWIIKYDRLYDRKTDNGKILSVTGLTESDFTPIKDGIKTELKKIL